MKPVGESLAGVDPARRGATREAAIRAWEDPARREELLANFAKGRAAAIAARSSEARCLGHKHRDR